MAYNNIYDWHDSLRKRWEQEQDQHRREIIAGWMDRVRGDEQHRFFTGRLNNRFKFNPEDWLKDIDGAKEDCGRKFPRKYGNNTDPNDITDLCKVEIIK